MLHVGAAGIEEDEEEEGELRGTYKNYEKSKSRLPDDVQSGNFSMRYRCASLITTYFSTSLIYSSCCCSCFNL
jgi:hypothetical protein